MTYTEIALSACDLALCSIHFDSYTLYACGYFDKLNSHVSACILFYAGSVNTASKTTNT